MTKPFIPEFTTRLAGLKYVANGRGDKRARATKDAWNTQVELLSDDDIILTLNGKTLLHWFEDSGDEYVQVHVPDDDFTTRKRINDYALTARNMELVLGKRLLGTVGTAIGNYNDGVDVRGELGSGVNFQLKGMTAEFPTPTPPRILNPDELRALADIWSDSVCNDLVSTKFTEDLTAVLCMDCTGFSNTILGETMGTREHMFAHLFGKQHNLSLLLSGFRVPGGYLNLNPISGTVFEYGRVPAEHAPLLKRHLRPSARRVFERLGI